MEDTQSLLPLLAVALEFRRPWMDTLGEGPALRLFNGFWEGWPGLAVDRYAGTLVFHGYAPTAEDNLAAARAALNFYLEAFTPPPTCALLKERGAADPDLRRGRLLLGDHPASQVREAGVWYALDLLRHQDASLFLDTRLLRRWAQENLAGAKVLNTFAYTGSLGAAAQAGGATRVVQTDRSGEFLAIAKQTYTLNGWTRRPQDFIAGDFFTVVARLKGQGALFDCVFLDPPFFAVTSQGRVDVNREMGRLINKVRPLVGDEGRLVAVNNGVFVSGQAYLDSLQAITAGGYAELEALIHAPTDFTGFEGAPRLPLPADPAPFNYSTKIAVLRLRRKDGRKA